MDPEVWVAIIGGAFLLVSTLVTTHYSRKSNQAAEKAVAQTEPVSNGFANKVNVKLDSIISSQDSLKFKQELLETDQKTTNTNVSILMERVLNLSERTARIETANMLTQFLPQQPQAVTHPTNGEGD